MRVLALGVHRFGSIPQQHELAQHQGDPLARPRGDEIERPPRPVGGDLARGQGATDRLFRQQRRVLTFEGGVPLPVAQRPVGAVGVRVVPDVEVGAELRRGQVEPVSHDQVACRHRQQRGSEAGDEHGRKRQSRAAQGALTPDQPRHDRHHEDQRVLAGEAQGSERQTGREPDGATPGLTDQQAHQPEHETQQKKRERRLLEHPVREDGRRREREQEASGHADAVRHQPGGGGREQTARGGTERRLTHADDEEVGPEDGVDRAEEVWVERRLVEHPVADPVTRRQLPRPRVVTRTVPERQVEERRPAHLPEVHEPNEQREPDDAERNPSQLRAGRRPRGERCRRFRLRLPRVTMPGDTTALAHRASRVSHYGRQSGTIDYAPAWALGLQPRPAAV